MYVSKKHVCAHNTMYVCMYAYVVLISSFRNIEYFRSGRLKPDGVVLKKDGQTLVTKAAIEPVWYLPGRKVYVCIVCMYVCMYVCMCYD